MSEAEAYLRIQAARVGRRFPLVVERLGAGAVHLSAIKLLSPHLTEGNHVQLLDRVRGRTKREIEVLVAELSPKPDVPARMRRLPEARQPAPQMSSAVPAPVPQASNSARASVAAQEPSDVTTQPPMAAAPSQSFALLSPRARASCTPLGPGRFRLELMLGQEAHDHLDQLRELLRHQNPSGDLASIVERALRELLQSTMKRRFAKTDVPARRSFRKPNVESKATSRYIPRAVLREVYTRDAGQCTFVSSDGRRCTERGFLEVHHHHTTFARGGEATVDNLRLTCRAHNQFLATEEYGPSFMKEKLREVAARPSDQLHL